MIRLSELANWKVVPSISTVELAFRRSDFSNSLCKPRQPQKNIWTVRRRENRRSCFIMVRKFWRLGKERSSLNCDERMIRFAIQGYSPPLCRGEGGRITRQDS